jgi:hypothetical protein
MKTAEKWWLTVTTASTQCQDCGSSLAGSRGRPVEIVYQHESKTILCEQCALNRHVRYWPSKRWRDIYGSKQRDGLGGSDASASAGAISQDQAPGAVSNRRSRGVMGCSRDLPRGDL